MSSSTLQLEIVNGNKNLTIKRIEIEESNPVDYSLKVNPGTEATIAVSPEGGTGIISGKEYSKIVTIVYDEVGGASDQSDSFTCIGTG